MTTGNPQEIEFWFDFGSQYSYLSVMRIEALSRPLGVAVVWKPFLLGPIFRELGWSTSPFVQQKERGAYMWKDIARQARKFGLPWQQPSSFPRSAVLPLRVTLAAAREPWVGAFCQAVMQRNFVADANIDTVEAVTAILQELGLPHGYWIDLALREENKLALRQQTEEARQRGIFGAPTFFVAGEMFWGNDRLDDALAFACEASEG